MPTAETEFPEMVCKKLPPFSHVGMGVLIWEQSKNTK